MLNLGAIDEALQKLNQKMVYSEVAPIEVVICGGAALLAMRLVSRTTQDVDIVALARAGEQKVELLKSRRLPKEFRRMITEIGMEMHMEEDWLNFAASPLLKFGLPPGIESRLQKKPYGACLTVYFIGRYDQVHFKIYAAMDGKIDGTRHLSDLIDLEPTEQEVQAATAWLLARETSESFKNKFKQVLERIGHEEFARTI